MNASVRGEDAAKLSDTIAAHLNIGIEEKQELFQTLVRKLKLKEDEDGKKVTDVRGIRAACKIMKTRYNKPFENVEIKIPWETGMDPYSGLIDLFEKKSVLVKDSTKLKYVDKSAREHKYFRSAIPTSLLDLIMEEWDESKVIESPADIDNF